MHQVYFFEQKLTSSGLNALSDDISDDILGHTHEGANNTGPKITSSGIENGADLLAGYFLAGETWTYASADDPTFTFTIANSDATTKYSAGMKIKLTQNLFWVSPVN